MIMLMLIRARLFFFLFVGYFCLADVCDLFYLFLMSGVYLIFCHYILCGGLNC